MDSCRRRTSEDRFAVSFDHSSWVSHVVALAAPCEAGAQRPGRFQNGDQLRTEPPSLCIACSRRLARASEVHVAIGRRRGGRDTDNVVGYLRDCWRPKTRARRGMACPLLPVSLHMRRPHGARRDFCAIPPTAVGGSFKHGLQRTPAKSPWESHPRQWVEASSPAYKREGDRSLFLGAPSVRPCLNDPPTAVGGIPQSVSDTHNLNLT